MRSEVVQQWVSSTGYSCEIIRLNVERERIGSYLSSGLMTEWLCGYVTVPNSHYPQEKTFSNFSFDVNGGITFFEFSKDGSATFGFDCAHYWDYENPKDEDFVYSECESLARQLYEWHNRPRISEPQTIEQAYFLGVGE